MLNSFRTADSTENYRELLMLWQPLENTLREMQRENRKSSEALSCRAILPICFSSLWRDPAQDGRVEHFVTSSCSSSHKELISVAVRLVI